MQMKFTIKLRTVNFTLFRAQITSKSISNGNCNKSCKEWIASHRWIFKGMDYYWVRPHTSSDHFLINGKYNISDYFCKQFQMMPGFT